MASVPTALVIADVTIFQDAQGRYNLNTLHHASGIEESKRPGHWLKRKSTQALVSELNTQVSFMTLDIVHGGERAGTYAHELLAVSYAGWISPAFQLKVNQAFIDMRTSLKHLEDPVEKYPELRAIRELIIATAEARDEATLARQEAHAAEVRAIRAETKADMALEDAHRMTIEEFILKNGLLHQFPQQMWRGIASWLGKFCQEFDLKMEKTPTPGKIWADEWSYPLRALGAWLNKEYRKPQQIHLVPKTETKGDSL